MSAAYQISTEEDQIVIRLERATADGPALARLLDYLALAAVRRRSALTDEDAAVLAADVKRGAWERAKHLFSDGWVPASVVVDANVSARGGSWADLHRWLRHSSLNFGLRTLRRTTCYAAVPALNSCYTASSLAS